MYPGKDLMTNFLLSSSFSLRFKIFNKKIFSSLSYIKLFKLSLNKLSFKKIIVDDEKKDIYFKINNLITSLYSYILSLNLSNSLKLYFSKLIKKLLLNGIKDLLNFNLFVNIKYLLNFNKSFSHLHLIKLFFYDIDKFILNNNKYSVLKFI